MLFNVVVVLLALFALANAQCKINQDEKACLLSSQSLFGVSTASCAWCPGSQSTSKCELALKAKAKSLFNSELAACSYPEKTNYLFSGATTCDAITSESTCMSSTQGGVKCSYCKSAAVGGTCLMETDAKGLPSSIFQVFYSCLELFLD